MKLHENRELESKNPGYWVCRKCDKLFEKCDLPLSSSTPYCPICRASASGADTDSFSYQAFLHRRSMRIRADKSGERYCARCNRILPKDMFYSLVASPNGLQHSCKDCVSKRNKRAREGKEIRLPHSEKLANKIFRQQKAGEKRIDKKIRNFTLLATRRVFYGAFFEFLARDGLICKKCGKTKKKGNFTDKKGKYKTSCHACRKGTRHKIEPKISPRGHGSGNGISRERLRIDSGGVCYYCKRTLGLKWEADHKTPMSRGGSHSLENIVASCKDCNGLKGRLTADEFFRSGAIYA